MLWPKINILRILVESLVKHQRDQDKRYYHQLNIRQLQLVVEKVFASRRYSIVEITQQDRCCNAADLDQAVVKEWFKKLSGRGCHSMEHRQLK